MWAVAKVPVRREERKLADREVVKEVDALYVPAELGCEVP